MERRSKMKNVLQRSAAVFLIFALVFTAMPFACGFEAHAAAPTQKQAYKKLIAMKSKYPEGKRWNDMESTYINDFGGGSGCYAFALLMSDAVFGKKLPYTKHKNLSELKVGDIVNVKNGGHYVIVLKVQKKSITVAEGNYGGRIHWNRKIPVSKLKKDKRLYILTRYYWKGFDVRETADSVELTWPQLSEAQQKKIDSIAVVRSGKIIAMLDKSAASFTDTDVSPGNMYFYQLKTYKKATSKASKKYEYSHETPSRNVFFMGGDHLE